MPSGADKGVGDKGPIIVVSGPPGSGKSTIAYRLSGELGLRYLSTGSIFREIARSMGVSLVELSRMAERDPSIDLLIDKRTIEEASRGRVVIDSHLAAWLIHDRADYLIYTKAPLPVRARRVAERDGIPVWRAYEEVLAREYSQWRRYKKYYGIDVLDLSIFHLVIDTGVYGREEAYRLALEGARARLGKNLI